MCVYMCVCVCVYMSVCSLGALHTLGASNGGAQCTCTHMHTLGASNGGAQCTCTHMHTHAHTCTRSEPRTEALSARCRSRIQGTGRRAQGAGCHERWAPRALGWGTGRRAQGAGRHERWVGVQGAGCHERWAPRALGWGTGRRAQGAGRHERWVGVRVWLRQRERNSSSTTARTRLRNTKQPTSA